MAGAVGRGLFWSLSAIGLGYMVWSLIFSDHGYLVYRQEAMQTELLRGELEEQQAERERLAKEVLRLRNDPDALEELVHRELGYVYPDEIIVMMPERVEEEEKGSGQ
ncbi:cell division protein FtsB [Mariprofundus ferrinatatus]|uniref:Cell division protein FtsB n=1 Tax=Mariprofundus ferrinatatus TaxID=1921087 RepID=A0A2K8L250_9PROT|nr:septum formation initiator family protein [Mariprofundus ferrinatatus]ATX81323.1 cell division protein FtsB [Mariprofundus ferrinatatus]